MLIIEKECAHSHTHSRVCTHTDTQTHRQTDKQTRTDGDMHARTLSHTHMRTRARTPTQTHMHNRTLQVAMPRHVLKGHNSTVFCVSISGDSQRIATGSKTIKMWDTATGHCTCTLRGHKGAVTCVDISRDWKRLVSGGGTDDLTIIAWDLNGSDTPKALLTLRGHIDAVCGVMFSPDGHKIASASDDGTVVIWCAQTGQKLLTFEGHVGGANCVAWSPDSELVASGGGDKTVRLWKVDTGTQVTKPLRGHSLGVTSVCFGSRRGLLASGGLEGAVVIRDIGEGGKATVRHTLRGRIRFVCGIALSPDDSYIACACG